MVNHRIVSDRTRAVMSQAFNYKGVVLSARLVRTVLATAVLAAGLGLTACGSADAPAEASGTAASTQQARNDHAHDLAAAQRATLVPVETRLELLTREQQRAELAGTPATATDVDERIDAYRDLADSIEAAPSAETVRTLVDRAGLDLGVAVDDSAVPTAAVTD